MSDIDKNALAQQWKHSHEEDTDTEMVFRPAGFNFPPSRGRSSFDLKPDGTLVEGGPGPTDRTETKQGSWKIGDQGSLNFYFGSSKQPAKVLKVKSARKDKLVVEK